MRVQLLLDAGDNNMVHWDRVFELENVWVLPLGDNSPRDLYIAYSEWAPPLPGEEPCALASLDTLLRGGATLCDAQRALPKGSPMQRVVIARYVDTDRESPTLAALDTVDDITVTEALRERIRARIPEDKT